MLNLFFTILTLMLIYLKLTAQAHLNWVQVFVPGAAYVVVYIVLVVLGEIGKSAMLKKGN